MTVKWMQRFGWASAWCAAALMFGLFGVFLVWMVREVAEPVEGRVVGVWTLEEQERSGVYAHMVIVQDDGEMKKVIGVWEHAVKVGDRVRVKR